jgi:large subunit ribosomal protein L29
MLKMQDLHKQGKEELITLYQDISKELYNLKCELRIARKTDKPHLLREKKKDRARVLTALQLKTEGKA